MEIKPIKPEPAALLNQILVAMQERLKPANTPMVVDARIALGPELAIVLDVRPASPLATIRF